MYHADSAQLLGRTSRAVQWWPVLRRAKIEALLLGTCSRRLGVRLPAWFWRASGAFERGPSRHLLVGAVSVTKRARASLAVTLALATAYNRSTRRSDCRIALTRSSDR
jgi:hypothetical protein